MWRDIESLARLHRGDGQEVHRVDDGLGELGRQRLGRVDTVRKRTIYRSTPLVWVYEQGFDILEEVGELKILCRIWQHPRHRDLEYLQVQEQYSTAVPGINIIPGSTYRKNYL